MELELRHLRVLCAIADLGGVGRAAAALGYTQPAMSTQLRRIEGMLGEGVFMRSSAGMELTAYGAHVVGQAREILVLADNLTRLRHSRTPATTRRLRLGAINTPVVPVLLDSLREAFPDLFVSVSSVYATGELLSLLEAGELDAGLGCDYPGLPVQHSPKLDHRAIRTVPVFVATPAGHPLGHRLEIPLEGLSEETWFVSSDDGVGWPGAFYDACQAAGFTPAVTHEFHVLDQLVVDDRQRSRSDCRSAHCVSRGRSTDQTPGGGSPVAASSAPVAPRPGRRVGRRGGAPSRRAHPLSAAGSGSALSEVGNSYVRTSPPGRRNPKDASWPGLMSSGVSRRLAAVHTAGPGQGVPAFPRPVRTGGAPPPPRVNARDGGSRPGPWWRCGSSWCPCVSSRW